VAVARAAFVPTTAGAILEALGNPCGVEWENVAPGTTPELDGIEPATPLFPRIDEPAPA
jgi:methionyl-tRNA synthetase